MTVQGLEVSSPADVAANEHAYCVSLPHETFASLYHNYPTIWEKTVLPSEEHNARFWSRARHLAQFHEHPIGRGKIWSSSAVIFSWTSLLAAVWSMGTKAARRQKLLKAVNMFPLSASFAPSPLATTLGS